MNIRVISQPFVQRLQSHTDWTHLYRGWKYLDTLHSVGHEGGGLRGADGRHRLRGHQPGLLRRSRQLVCKTDPLLRGLGRAGHQRTLDDASARQTSDLLLTRTCAKLDLDLGVPLGLLPRPLGLPVGLEDAALPHVRVLDEIGVDLPEAALALLLALSGHFAEAFVQ